MRFVFASLSLLLVAGCARSHSNDRRDTGPRSADGGWDASVDAPDPRLDTAPDAPILIERPPTSDCTDFPAATECVAMCELACDRFVECGGDSDAGCLDACFRAYACPGETPGHDTSICTSEIEGLEAMACGNICSWVSDLGGRGTGPVCTSVPPSTTCGGRAYCDCTGGCEPLIDTGPGCVCPCYDPFNCSGDDCDCGCGGARYVGCAPVGLCDVTEVSCVVGGIAAISDGCPVCIDPDE